jgi:hypothetical protein
LKVVSFEPITKRPPGTSTMPFWHSFLAGAAAEPAPLAAAVAVPEGCTLALADPLGPAPPEPRVAKKMPPPASAPTTARPPTTSGAFERGAAAALEAGTCCGVAGAVGLGRRDPLVGP